MAGGFRLDERLVVRDRMGGIRRSIHVAKYHYVPISAITNKLDAPISLKAQGIKELIIEQLDKYSEHKNTIISSDLNLSKRFGALEVRAAIGALTKEQFTLRNRALALKEILRMRKQK